MFHRSKSKAEGALTGAPAIRREKNYASESGYLYHYFYNGNRAAPGGTEHVFDVSADQREFFRVSVFLQDASLAPWETAHQRALTTPERYAVAKLALRKAFDDSATPAELSREVRPTAAEAEEILENLGVE